MATTERELRVQVFKSAAIMQGVLDRLSARQGGTPVKHSDGTRVASGVNGQSPSKRKSG